MPKFDHVDAEILKLVQEDSRMTIKEIAYQLNLSTTPIFERLKRLEKGKVIQRYVALVDPKKVGKKLTVFINITIIDHSKKGLDAFLDQVTKYPEVIECHHITGDADFFLKVVVEDIERYNQFLTSQLSRVPNVGKVKSSFSLSVGKSTTAIDIDSGSLPERYVIPRD